MKRTVAFLLIGGLATMLAGSALAQEIDWKKVDAALGRTGAAMPGGVHRYGLPRSDLKVAVDGVAIKPALALGGWVAFEPAHDGAMVMGDVVLTESEIKPVMTKLLEGAMGSANAINFQPTGAGKAAITGDFVVTADEVNPLIRALRANEIEVTAIHSHMLKEQPRLFFVHFWANDDAVKLAKGIRAALDKTAFGKS